MRKELIQFLVCIENAVLGEIIGRLDGAHPLSPRLLVDRLDMARRHRLVISSVRGHCCPGRRLGKHVGEVAVDHRRTSNRAFQRIRRSEGLADIASGAVSVGSNPTGGATHRNSL
jgi:hypothetical protein